MDKLDKLDSVDVMTGNIGDLLAIADNDATMHRLVMMAYSIGLRVSSERIADSMASVIRNNGFSVDTPIVKAK